jgi:glycine/D-amino acid oxidase-like deaminating enzyme
VTVLRSLDTARPTALWYGLHDHQPATKPLRGAATADLVVVGGGFTGLWTAVMARRRHPERNVVLLEADSVGFGASGRNGGFVSESITHGLSHGLALWPDRIDELLEIGRRNVAGLVGDLAAAGIDAQVQLTGKTVVATRPHEVDALGEIAELMSAHGEQAEVLDAAQVRADIDSPTYRGGIRVRTGGGILDPLALALGLREWATRLGVRIHERTRVRAVASDTVVTDEARIRTPSVVIATNAYRNVARRLRRFVVPVYDHVLATEPLSADQWASIGWPERQGVTDLGNQFHYYRPTPDGRILWGGYDAIYYYGSSTSPAKEQRDASHRLLARQFAHTFPQLRDVGFTHRWAGLIDTSSRFVPYVGVDRRGRVAHAIGFTGLGVAYSRLAASIMLDALDGIPVPFYVGRRPMPFPPEPLRYLSVQATRAALAREDRTGHRGVLLRTLDRFGVGFNS